MAVLKKYWTPDYYSDFHCKGPECRCSCCHGWGITLTMQEYFRLLGMDCTPELRRRLDCSFHLVDSPTEERYAQITPDWRGDCPLHMENGYCRLQYECGESVLTSVCKYYPRSPRTVFANECACSNSCEGVLELMFKNPEPLKIRERELSFELPEQHFDGPEWLAEHYGEIRVLCVDTLQDRRLRFCDRLILLGHMLEKLHEAHLQENSAAIADAIAECRNMKPEPHGRLTEADALRALNAQHRMSMVFGEHSQSVEAYAHSVETTLGLEGQDYPDAAALSYALERYRAAAEHLEKVVPQWEILFEHMMVNHVFYESFPFSDRHENLWEEHLSLCAVYAFVRYLAVCWMRDKEKMDDFVDVCAAAFRLIDHSGFDLNAAMLLESMHMQTGETMAALVKM